MINFETYKSDSNTIILKNKVVVITGASSGIGEALARKFNREGAKVVLAARTVSKLEALSEELNKNGTEAFPVACDVAKKEDCDALVAAAVEKFGGIDVLINNAGISMRALFENAEVEVIEQLMQVNFFGTVYCTKAALPHILKSKGNIIGVSSIAGYRGLPGRTGYSASKFAMQGFLESLRTELLKKGVHVLVACPGFTSSNIRKTALTADGSKQGESPLNEQKIMSSEEVADHIYNATVRRKRTIVLTSQGKLTVFLNKLFPKFMDKQVYNHFAKEPDSPLK